MAEPEEMYQCQAVSCGYIYDPDRGDRSGKIPKVPVSKTSRRIGVVPHAGPLKKCSNPSPDRVPS